MEDMDQLVNCMTTKQRDFVAELTALLKKYQTELHVEFDPNTPRDKVVAYVGDDTEGVNMGSVITFNIS